MASMLRHLISKEGAEAVKTRVQEANVELQKYLPSFERDDEGALKKIIESYELAEILA